MSQATSAPSGRVGVGAEGEVGRQRPPLAVARMGSAGRAVPDRAACVLDGALGATGALADPDQGEADLGLSDDGDQPCAVPSGMGVEPVEEILSPVLDLPTVRSGLR